MVRLMKCRACGKEVAASAKACPACGAKHPALSNRAIAITCLVIFGMAAIFGTYLALTPDQGHQESALVGDGGAVTQPTQQQILDGRLALCVARP